MKVDIYDLLAVYEKEISKHCKNKRKILKFDQNKIENICYIKYLLENNLYIPSKYNIFIIRDPKYRIVMSLNIKDKIVNHYFARFILIPKLEKYLDSRCIATRKNMGTDYGIRLVKSYLEHNKKYGNFYILKIDIKKYFYNIDHEVLKKLLIDKLTREEYLILEKIIDSTNLDYVNDSINKQVEIELKKRKHNAQKINDLPRYKYGKGLSLGAMTSQFLSIFYLYKLDFFIVHKLGLKYMCHYMDDILIMHHDKDYLKKCLSIITSKLENEYLLEVNQKKTFIVNNHEGFIFLGYHFKVINGKTIISIRQDTINKVNSRIKEITYQYQNDYINFLKSFSSINTYYYCFKYANNFKIREILDNHFFEKVSNL